MPEITGGSISLLVAAVRHSYSLYEGYRKGKLSATDKGLRDEVRRRLGMIRNHLVSTHQRALENRWVKSVIRVEAAIETVDMFHKDTTTNITGTMDSKHLDAKKPSVSDLKLLIEHDQETLERLEAATELVDQTVAGISVDTDGVHTTRLIDTVQHTITGARNHFNERTKLLGSIA